MAPTAALACGALLQQRRSRAQLRRMRLRHKYQRLGAASTPPPGLTWSYDMLGDETVRAYQHLVHEYADFVTWSFDMLGKEENTRQHNENEREKQDHQKASEDFVKVTNDSIEAKSKDIVNVNDQLPTHWELAPPYGVLSGRCFVRFAHTRGCGMASSILGLGSVQLHRWKPVKVINEDIANKPEMKYDICSAVDQVYDTIDAISYTTSIPSCIVNDCFAYSLLDYTRFHATQTVLDDNADDPFLDEAANLPKISSLLWALRFSSEADSEGSSSNDA